LVCRNAEALQEGVELVDKIIVDREALRFVHNHRSNLSAKHFGYAPFQTWIAVVNPIPYKSLELWL
jgi:hypothetical protein